MVSKVKPITDPDVLAALNAPAPEQQAPTPITDPATLARLNAPPKQKGAVDRGLSYAGDVAGNAPGDFLDVTKNIAGAIWSPLDTGKKALQTLVGAGLTNSSPEVVDWFNKHGDPEKVKELIGMADAAGGQLKEEYGSLDKFGETFRKHPVKVLVDLGMIASGTGGVLRGGARVAGATEGGGAAAGALNKAADVAGKVADYTNPLTPVMKAGTFGLNLGRNALALAKDPRGYLYRNAIGDRGPQVMNQLNAFQETVPGMESTIGQASVGSGAGDLNALSAGILDSSTNARNAALARTQANRAAAEAPVAQVAGTEADLAAAEKLRTDNASALYGLSDAEQATAGKVFHGLLDRPSMGKVMARANELAAEAGKTLGEGKNIEARKVGTDPITGRPIMSQPSFATYSGQDLHWIKKAFDDVLEKKIGEPGLSANEAAAVTGTKKAFTDWVEKRIPAYKEAKDQFIVDSLPIDQMKVAQELQKKLRGPLGNFTPANYNSALLNESSLIKEATGTNRYDKISSLYPDPVKAKLDAVRDRFIREAEDKRLATGGEAVEGVKAPKIPWGLSSKVALANKIILALANKINKNVAMDMAADMLDVPRGTAAIKKALEKPNPKNLETLTVRPGLGAIMNNLAPANQNNLGASE
jgi:hypothetical protein